MRKVTINSTLLGVSSIILGIASIIITALCMYFYKRITAFNSEYVFQFVQALNVLSKIELIIKPIGLMAGIVGLFGKNTNKVLPTIGTALNIVAIVWTLIFIYS